MQTIRHTRVLSDEIWPAQGAALALKRAALLALGIALLALSAKIRVPLWPSPVPLTFGTFAVMLLGAAYGPRLGLATLLGYLGLGALGFDVFANSSATENGLSYMAGPTGGYLVGFVLASLALGVAARRGWDRNVWRMALAMAIGNALIYAPGLLWLGHVYGWNKPILAWGLTPFLIGDALKLALAAVLLPGVWRIVGRARG